MKTRMIFFDKNTVTIPAKPLTISILGDNNATGISALSAPKTQPATHYLVSENFRLKPKSWVVVG